MLKTLANNKSASTKLLVTFCNIFPKGFNLGVLDFSNYKFQWIEFADNVAPNGITGLAFHNDRFWFVSQDPTPALYRLDKDLKVDRAFHLSKTSYAHSFRFAPIEDGFLITDTGRNRINKITISKDNRHVQETEFWKYNSDIGDTVHLNSIACVKDKIFVSLFGPKPKEGWQRATAGTILEVTENRKLVNNLKHPHSLTEIDGHLFFLESSTGRVHRISKTGKDEIILQLRSYLRGIAHDQKYLYIGGSARRRKPRSQGTTNVPETLDPDLTHCFIFRVDKKTLKWERRDLTIFGTEIYDLLVLPYEYSININKNAMIERIWKYEDEITSLQDLKVELEEIKQSFGYSFMKFYSSILDRVLPHTWLDNLQKIRKMMRFYR